MAGKITSSPILKLSAYITAAVALLFLITYMSTDELDVDSSDNTSTNGSSTGVDQSATAGSNPGALTSDVRQLYARIGELENENNQLSNQVDSLGGDGQSDSYLNVSAETIDKRIKDALAKYDFGSSKLGSTDMNVGQSTDDALLDNNEKRDGAGFKINGYTVSPTSNSSINDEEIEWITPEGVEVNEEDGIQNFISSAKEALPFDGLADSEEKKRKERLIQYATIDADAILFGAVALNSLIGVTPTDGSVQSPYQFKIELGQDNLATSGVYLPDIALMRFSGYAVGEWSTGCVEARLTSATFVFDDGVIASITPIDKSGNQGEGSAAIGYISDVHGTPCIKGKKYSTLLEYASVSGALSALSSVGEGLANAQFDVQSNANGISQAFTGDQLELSAGKGLSGGLGAINQAVAKRYAQVRDIIVAPPGKYVLNMTKQLNIDYDPNGRRLINDNFDAELEGYYEEQHITNSDR